MCGDKKSCFSKHIIVFGIVVSVKLIFMGLFSSDYQSQMFIPFVNSFLSGNNPYDYYYTNNIPTAFPYFPLMLLIESTGGIILRALNLQSIFWTNFIFKLPLLVFDIAGYAILMRMNTRFKYILIFYFCSPIILYSTYIHGQLDIIPTVFLIAAVYFLTNYELKNNLIFYAFFLGCALSCKAHIAASIPVLFFYLANKRDYITAVKIHIISLCTVFAFTFAFFGDGFIHTVLMNKEQTMLTSVNMDYGTVQLAIPIMILTIVYLQVYELNYFNRNLLISTLGLLFTIFLIFVSPMPGWFVWIVPFYTLYFGIVSEEKYKLIFIYAFFNAAYLLYFVFFHINQNKDIILMGESLQWLKVESSNLKSVVFAVMVACLAVVVHKIYRFGIASNDLYKRRGKSFVIGIAGDSGAGKSRLLDKIEHLFGGARDILFIEGDGDHKWGRNDKNWEQYTALNPHANYLYKQAEDIRKLKNGNYVFRTEYNHNTGEFTEKRRVGTKKYVVLCGLHSLYLPALRDELDLKIYLDTDNVLKSYWKIQRDTRERGYSKDKVIAQIKSRAKDAEKYIYPQREYADIIIKYFDKTLKSPYEENHNEKLGIRFEVSLNVDLEELIKSFNKYGVFPKHWICDDMRHQCIEFLNEEITHFIDFKEIAETTVSQYEDFFSYYPVWGSDVEGVVQFMILYIMSERMRG